MAFPGEDILSLVVDIGSHTTRSGYAGDEGPKQLWNSCVGYSENGTTKPSISSLRYPLDFKEKLEDCIVKPCYSIDPNSNQFYINDDVFEKIIAFHCEGRPSGSISSTKPKFNHNISDSFNFPPRLPISGLGINVSEFPVLLSEPCNPSNQLREKITEIMFEKFNAPAIYLAKRAVLSALTTGRASGLVVDIGASTLSISPVTEAYIRMEQLLEFPIAGNLLDIQFSHILAEQGYPLYPFFAIKRKYNGKSLSMEKVDCTKVHSTYLQHGQFETARTLKEAICRVAEDEYTFRSSTQLNGNSRANPLFQSYINMPYNELPDGTQLDIEPYAYTVPEILFQPQLIKSENPRLIGQFRGLTSSILQSISESEIEIRKELLGSIILTGGTSNIQGLSERLSRSLQKSNPLSSKIRVTHSDRRYSTWVGGSILASMSSFHNLWLSSEEYNEHGPSVAKKKFT